MTRRHLKVGELPEEVRAAIERSEMDPRHDHLNALMEDEPTSSTSAEADEQQETTATPASPPARS